jgi:hypothetical protein
MAATNQMASYRQQFRQRAMLARREHGIWGLLLVPLFTGLVVGLAPEYRLWSLLLLQFVVAALSLFALRAGGGNLLGIGPVSAHTLQNVRRRLLGQLFSPC